MTVGDLCVCACAFDVMVGSIACFQDRITTVFYYPVRDCATGVMRLVCGSVCPSHTFWAICVMKALSRARYLLKDRFHKRNRLYMIDDCNNHAKAIKTVLSSILQTVPPLARLWALMGQFSRLD